MYRRLRDIVCLVAAAMLTGIAVCHADSPGAGNAEMRCILEVLHHDAFSPCTPSPDNYMEHPCGGQSVIPAAQHASLRGQYSANTFSLTTISNFVHTLISSTDERQTGMSRQSDYYVFGLGHIQV